MINMRQKVEPLRPEKTSDTGQSTPKENPASQSQQHTPANQGLALQALKLLQFEEAIRKLPDTPSLLVHLVNATRQLLPFEQAMVCQRHRFSGRLKIIQVSDIPQADRKSPLLLAMEQYLHVRGKALQQSHIFTLAESDQSVLKNHALPYGMWIPLGQSGQVDAGLVCLRSQQPFLPAELSLAQRLAGTYTHAWLALEGKRSLATGSHRFKPLLWAVPLLLVACGFIPVPLSVVAPVEVVARDPWRLTAPIEGVVRQIRVEPNSPVKQGDALLQFEDLKPYNEMVVAGRKLAVAEARSEQVNSAAFDDPDARAEMAVAGTEYQLAKVNYQYMSDVYQRTRVTAPVNGVAIFTNKREWEGKPVRVGEEIMQIADPHRIQFRIDLPLKDNIPLKQGSDVTLFLDSSPMKAWHASLSSYSYTPQTTPEGISSYVLLADLQPGEGYPRIGARGTARVYSETVPLWFQLLRRPIAWVRQHTGV